MLVQSPSKINLYLKVTGRRKDGYHKLTTIFQRISLRDTLFLQKQKSGFKLSCKIVSGLDQTLSCGEDNLITKAYRLLQKKFPKLGGVSVRLLKKNPLGAGLGAGSGNAAAFLIGMKKLFRLKISQAELVNLGSRLGADVAFFVHCASLAVGRGVGDKISVQKKGKKNWFVLILEAQSLSTPQVYKALPKKLPAVSVSGVNIKIKKILKCFQDGSGFVAGSFLENDLELPAFSLRPELKKMFKKICLITKFPVRMSGSGPTFFCVLPSQFSARKLARRLRAEFPRNKILISASY